MFYKYILICLVSLFFSNSSIVAAELLNLKINFEGNSWREVLKKASRNDKYKIVSRNNTDKCLEVSHKVMLASQKFPYNEGNIQISLDAKTTNVKPAGKKYKVIRFMLVLFNDEGKQVGHKDVLMSRKAADWKEYSMNVKNICSGTSFFQIRFGNSGKSGKLWVDNIKVSIEVEGKSLCGDPGFNGNFAVDHWNNPREGKDWNNLKLKSKNGSCSYVKGIFPDGGKSLYIKNNATFTSNRYKYNGGPLLFGAWIKYKNIKRGQKGWAWANIQLVLFDEDGKIIGHKNLTPLKISTSEWKYYSRYLRQGILKKNTAYMELWVRCFEGATGESWFDEIQLVNPPSGDAKQHKYNAKTATVTIDASKPEAKEIRPVWSATDISYATKISYDVVKGLLTELRNNGITHLRLREFMQGCNILKKIDASGKPIYNWNKLDKIIDWAVKEKGFILTPTIETTPNQIAEKQGKKKIPPNNRYAPKDVKLWGKIAYDLVNHWIERYGIEKVSKWNFECWNEPCSLRYFKGTKSQFIQIFNEYFDVMCKIEKKYNHSLDIGTFSGTSNSTLYKIIFDRLQKQKKLKKLNTVSLHVYAGFINSFDALEGTIKRIQKLVAGYPDLKGSSLILTEVNGSSMNNPGRDSRLSAAFNVKASRVYLDTGVKRGYYFAPVDYMFRKKDIYFNGGSGYFTKNGIPKAAFNSLVLLNKLRSGKRLPFKSSNEPLDGISVIDGNTLKVLLTSFDERSITKNFSTKVTLTINWPKAPRDIKAISFQVNKKRANSYSKWVSLGKPKISDKTNKILRAANKLKSESFTNFKFKGNKLKTTLNIPNNSLIYLEFKGTK